MKKTLFVLSFTLATLLGFSQHVLPDYVMVDVDSDTLRVRWEPSSLDEWFHSIDNGYDITISRKFDSGYQVVKSENIKLLDRASHIATANGQSDFLSQFYRSSVNLMYADKDPESGMSHLMKSIRKKSESTIDSFKINMLSYFSIFDIDLARHNGLGYVYKIDQGGDYKIEVSTGSYPASSIEFNTNDTSTIPDVALSAKFGSKNVKLTWDTKELVGKYFGFYLEKSENGINYEKTTDLPYVMPKKRENLEYRGQISAIDSFPVNYEDKFYGIRVVDYFGTDMDLMRLNILH